MIRRISHNLVDQFRVPIYMRVIERVPISKQISIDPFIRPTLTIRDEDPISGLIPIFPNGAGLNIFLLTSDVLLPVPPMLIRVSLNIQLPNLILKFIFQFFPPNQFPLPCSLLLPHPFFDWLIVHLFKPKPILFRIPDRLRVLNHHIQFSRFFLQNLRITLQSLNLSL
jgi:hypothetical protein